MANSRAASKQQETQAQIAVLGQQEKRIDQQIATLQENLRAIPSREQQLSELQRDYNTSKENFERAQAKFQDAKLSSSLELGLQNARFRIQDFASLPERPIWPIPWKLNLSGLAGGLLAALVLAVGLEFRDSAMKSERDVEYYLEVKTLAIVPELQTPNELKHVRRKKLLGIFGSVTIALSLSCLLVYLYLLRK